MYVPPFQLHFLQLKRTSLFQSEHGSCTFSTLSTSGYLSPNYLRPSLEENISKSNIFPQAFSSHSSHHSTTSCHLHDYFRLSITQAPFCLNYISICAISPISTDSFYSLFLAACGLSPHSPPRLHPKYYTTQYATKSTNLLSTPHYSLHHKNYYKVITKTNLIQTRKTLQASSFLDK